MPARVSCLPEELVHLSRSLFFSVPSEEHRLSDLRLNKGDRARPRSELKAMTLRQVHSVLNVSRVISALATRKMK